MPIRTGIVGLRHGMASVLEVLKNSDFELVALCSASRESYDYLLGAEIKQPLDSVTFTESRESLIAAAKHRCDFRGVAFFEDYDRFLLEADIDAVILAVPVHLNASYGIKALKAGKHLFVSKPVAITTREALAFHQAICAAKSRFVLNFEFRRSPLFEAVRNEVADGKIGKIRLMSWNMFRMPFRAGYRRRELSGGPFIAEICHWIDLFNFLSGGATFRRTASFGGLDVLADIQDFADHACSVFEYDGGTVGSINFTYFTDYPEHNVFAIVGETGKITGNTDGAGKFALYAGGDSKPIQRRFDDSVEHQGHLGFDRSHSYFADSVISGLDVNRKEADAGLESAVVAIAADRAMTEGRIVTREEILSDEAGD